MRPLGERKNAQFHLVLTCFSLGSRVLLLALAPLNPPVPLPPAGVQHRYKCLWIIVCPVVPACKLPTVNFIIALYGVACCVFQS